MFKLDKLRKNVTTNLKLKKKNRPRIRFIRSKGGGGAGTGARAGGLGTREEEKNHVVGEEGESQVVLFNTAAIHDDEDHNKYLCFQASIACLQGLHDHVIDYLNRNLGGDDSSSSSNSDSSSSTDSCSYEGWIKECHPENTSLEDDDDNNKTRPSNGDVDFRFYLKDSDHRIIWNGYVDAYGYPELKIESLDDEQILIMSKQQ